MDGRTLNNRHSQKPPGSQQEIEAVLLRELKSAEAKFKQAGPGEKRAAEKEFRDALRRFSALVLDVQGSEFGV
jgi:hypothetical protein